MTTKYKSPYYYVYRDARTGHYVTAKYAIVHPHTTIRERRKRKPYQLPEHFRK